MARVPGRILLAVDGEPHTDEAVCWAVDLALGLGVTLNPVHIRDPYLKQFSNEIYAQGREEYLEHVATVPRGKGADGAGIVRVNRQRVR